MIIKSIRLNGFRNYSEREFVFSNKGCLMIGDNGIGKTNLFEAMTYFAFGKSIHNASDQALVQFDHPFFRIDAEYVDKDIPIKLEASFQTQKQIKLDNVPLQKLSDLYDYIQVVYFSPDDIHLIIGNPKTRRRFLDMSIAKLVHVYIDIQKKYHHILQQRNNLLKNGFTPEEKKAWDQRFIESSLEVIRQRKHFLQKFLPVFQQSFNEISGQREEVGFMYKPSVDPEPDNPEKTFQDLLRKITESEMKYKRTLFGPHTDDLIFYINGQPAGQYASQGQKRTLVIALKLAMTKMIFKETGTNPILFFDDTLAELDETRSGNLIRNLSDQHQIFIATPNYHHYKNFDLPVLKLTKEFMSESLAGQQ